LFWKEKNKSQIQNFKCVLCLSILGILVGFNGKLYRRVEIEKKKLKDGYPKLTLFKVWVPSYKTNERLEIISEVFSKKK
jgi:hypothetical protein